MGDGFEENTAHPQFSVSHARLCPVVLESSSKPPGHLRVRPLSWAQADGVPCEPHFLHCPGLRLMGGPMRPTLYTVLGTERWDPCEPHLLHCPGFRQMGAPVSPTLSTVLGSGRWGL